MAKVIFNERIGLWRIVDEKTGKAVRGHNNKTADNGGCRTELDAYRLLKIHESRPKTREVQRQEAREKRLKEERRLARIKANVERRLAKAKPD